MSYIINYKCDGKSVSQKAYNWEAGSILRNLVLIALSGINISNVTISSL